MGRERQERRGRRETLERWNVGFCHGANLAALCIVFSVALVDLSSPKRSRSVASSTRARFFSRSRRQTTPRGSSAISSRKKSCFFKPAPWVQFAAGFVGRANSHDQVERAWRLDIRDRGIRRPALSTRRLSATFTHGPLTVDIGKQFIRWGKADIVTPTDHFAPQDFLNVIDTEFLAVTGARGSVQRGSDSVEGVWVPFFTPSRTPLLNQRWTAVPAGAEVVSLFDASGPLPKRSLSGVRWGHISGRYEFSLSYFDGFNHLPNIVVTPGPRPFVVGIAKTLSGPSILRFRCRGSDGMADP